MVKSRLRKRECGAYHFWAGISNDAEHCLGYCIDQVSTVGSELRSHVPIRQSGGPCGGRTFSWRSRVLGDDDFVSSASFRFNTALKWPREQASPTGTAVSPQRDQGQIEKAGAAYRKRERERAKKKMTASNGGPLAIGVESGAQSAQKLDDVETRLEDWSKGFNGLQPPCSTPQTCLNSGPAAGNPAYTFYLDIICMTWAVQTA